MPEPILEVDGLVKHFPGPRRGQTVHAVNGVSFSIHPGETVALVGESGSGKSTIGRAVVRLVTPTRGAVRFEGRDLARLPAGECRRLRSRLQMVFQDPWGSLNPCLKIGTLIAEPLLLHARLDRAARRRRVIELTDRVRLGADLLSRYPGELSGGQLQRVCLARAIATTPRLIVLDEPTSSLDLSVRAGILDLLAELARDTGTAMLFISHDLGTVRVISDRVLVLYLGTVVESGPAAAVYERPAHPYTQALLSAHLSPDPAVRPHRHVLAGETPSPIDLPPGCPFTARCPLARDDCHAALPEPHRIDGGRHEARCVRVPEGTSLLRRRP